MIGQGFVCKKCGRSFQTEQAMVIHESTCFGNQLKQSSTNVKKEK